MDLQYHDIIKEQFDNNKIKYNKKDNMEYSIKQGKCIINYNLTDNSFTFNIVSKNYISLHISRILNLYTKDTIHIDEYLEFLQRLINILKNPYKLCTVCGKDNIYNQNLLCMDKECKYIEEGMLTDNCITDMYNKDLRTFNLLIDCTYKAISITNKKALVINPYPYQFCKEGEKYYRDTMEKGSNIKFHDIDRLRKSVVSKDKLLKLLEEDNDDIYLYDNLGKESYGLIKFIIRSNRSDIQSIDFIKQIDNKKELYYNEIKGVTMYELKYHPSVEKKFNDMKFKYLYHGSPLQCWHPIIRHGLRNVSNTSLMTTGAAYGAGIYFSENINLALQYSRGSTVIGICMVNDYEKYHKPTINYYVVPDNSKVLLKYLIRINTYSVEVKNYLHTYFSVERKNEILKSNIMLSKKYNKRLIKEYKILAKNKFFNIIEKDDDHCILDISKDIYSKNDNMYKELVKHKIDNIRILFQFIDYPARPPIVSLVSPYLNHCGIVLDNSLVMFKNIHLKNWTLADNINKVTLKLLKLLNGLDISIKGNKYSVNKEKQITYYNTITQNI